MSDALPEIPVRDYRDGGLARYAAEHTPAAGALMDTVLRGMGVGGHLLRLGLARGDRVAERWLRRTGDPYLDEVLEIRDRIGRPGPVTFSLSYEFGCTARIFEGAPPRLFRTLDWPFRGLGRLVEIVRLQGPAGEWVTATWPGVVGVMHGTAPGRFAAALNQAPERRHGAGRAVDWIAGKIRFLRSEGMPPAHLLRRVFETAPDFTTARQMLRDTPLASPAIFSIAGLRSGQEAVIERTETRAMTSALPCAANEFTAIPKAQLWRARGYDSAGRLSQIAEMREPPFNHVLHPPILNPLTRLAVSLDAAGEIAVTGYDEGRAVTRMRRIEGAGL